MENKNYNVYIKYLPYNLQVLTENGERYKVDNIDIIKGLFYLNGCDLPYDIGKCKPILVSIRDLCSGNVETDLLDNVIYDILEIINLDGYHGIYSSYTIDDNKFIFYIFGEYIATLNYDFSIIDIAKTHNATIHPSMYFKIYDILSKYSIDFNGYIDNGLAVNINNV